MKKRLSVIMAIGIMLSSLSAYAAEDKINVTINGDEVLFDTEPVILQDRTFVPIRAVCEKLGADVYWHDESKETMIVKNDTKLLMENKIPEMLVLSCHDFDELLALKDNNTLLDRCMFKGMDVAPTIMNDRTLLPIRYVCEELGATVDWDEETKTVLISCDEEALKLENQDKDFYEQVMEYFNTYDEGGELYTAEE